MLPSQEDSGAGVPMTEVSGQEENRSEPTRQRESWNKHLDYMLTMVGFCVALGNILRFPYICNRNGGGDVSALEMRMLPTFVNVEVAISDYGCNLLFHGEKLTIVELQERLCLNRCVSKGSTDVCYLIMKELNKRLGETDVSTTMIWKDNVRAFLIPFILLLCITGFPSFFVEATICQFSGKGAKQVWSFCPMLKGVGVGSLLMNCLYMPYYTLFLAWSIYYMVKSCSSVLPWTTCGNTWNTALCVEDENTTYNSNGTNMAGNTSVTITLSEHGENGTLARTPAEEFFRYNVLNVSSGLEDVGAVQWHIVGCLCASYAVYVTALLPYVLLVSIFITVMQEPGALDGLYHYVIPDFNKLLDIQVWLEACLQVFYSLGVGFGMIGTAASYNSFHESCLKNSLILTIVSEGTSIFSGLVTFATLGFMSQKADVPIETVVANVPGN
ncbi:sodium- and chloride-dependent creatine transporter 1-like [Haliotis rubra]|uniref:sodium- and chloride-dependent creatine transporter 1-like n=1 Tax=Haliotis rubra TaxID=36100 RepID=UPI001EE63138|nr:sodium- and chloride-dependent creatine transporter 1-like [Haliotis rubra]